MLRFLLCFFVLVASCGTQQISRSCALDGEACHDTPSTRSKGLNINCSVMDTGSDVVISCPDGTTSVIKKPKDGSVGPRGSSGADGISTVGKDGKNGLSLVFLITDSLTCPTGGKMIMIAKDVNDSGTLDIGIDSDLISSDICNGIAGEKGEIGATGQTGAVGSSGSNGRDGVNAPPSPFLPVGLLNPCGDAPGIFDEVFLKLSNGTVLASFSDNENGKNTRFSVLVNGTYMTTDSDRCIFTITDGVITSENHHY